MSYRANCLRFGVFIGFAFLCGIVSGQYGNDIAGNYCRYRYPTTCCTGRDDACSVPILGTLCYCDVFCNRTGSGDCCPDFWEVCRGVPRPELIVRPECFHKGKYYKVSQSIQSNCNKCTCLQRSPTEFQFHCDQNVCLLQPELISAVNDRNIGWKADNYSQFWGKTLEEGISHRLGTFKPTRPTMDMTEIHMITNGPLPESFDARDRWRGLIQPIRDQGDCAASWAFSTTALASDRLAIESLGMDRLELSPQQLLSCQKRGQRACEGGHLDKAWFYLRKHGVTTEQCFPYSSGKNGEKLHCPFSIRNGFAAKSVTCPDGTEAMLYHSTPPYRVGPKEEEIMREIYYNGPVQGAFRVHGDFFSYKTGVYRQSHVAKELSDAFGLQGWHSVRIIGWGVEVINREPVKYWVCANSWGSWWGEDGYFRILRGEDECDIEMFIVGVWANMNGHAIA